MKGREANGPCPCGSGIKYKNCYGKARPDCNLYLTEHRDRLLAEHPEKEAEVFAFFNDAVEDVKRVFMVSGIDKIVSPRLQVICAFALAEVFASYWDRYTSSPPMGSDDRFHVWFTRFCTATKNETYAGSEDFKRLGVESLMQLRHSLVHFFGLSVQTPGKQMALASNDMDKETFGRFKGGFKSTVAVMKPIEIYSLFRDGALLMLGEMQENIRRSATEGERKWLHVEGINRIYNKFKNEGAKMVLFQKSTPIPKE